MPTNYRSPTLENATVTTTADKLVTALNPDSSAVPVKKRKQYNALSKSEKADLLRLIVGKFGISVTRKQLQSLVDEDDGRPWAVFRFIANDKAVKDARGVYFLDRLKGFDVVKIAESLGVSTKTGE